MNLEAWKEIIDLCGGPEKFKELSNIKPKKEVTMAKDLNQRTMEDALKSMVELVENQQKAIRTADELFKLKDARLDVVDRLITICKKENKVLKICFYSLLALNIITSLIILL